MPKLRIDSNMDQQELVPALAGAILDAGVGPDVQDALSESRAGGGEQAEEPEVKALLMQWSQRHNDLRARILSALDAWEEMKRQQPGRFGVQMLRVRKRRKLPPGVDDVYESAALIAEMYRMAALAPSGQESPFAWAVLYRDAWREGGLDFSGETMQSYPVLSILAEYAYQYGRGAEIRAAMAERGYNRVEQNAAVFAAVHAGSFITGIGDGLAGEVRKRGTALLAPFYRDTIAQHLRGELRDSEEFITQTWRDLARVLRETVTGDEVTRNMDRVAATEIRWAFNVGRVQALIDDGTRYVKYRVSPDACQACRRVYLKPDGTPRIFALAPIVRDIAQHGGLNAGRKAWQYVPSALLHPHCNCSIHAADAPD